MARARLICVATMLVLSFAVCSGDAYASTADGSRPILDTAIAQPSQDLRHLYVLEHALKAVYRFPIAADGLPAIKPDGVFYPQGSNYPMGLTVDKAGHVFIADPGLGTVDEFAAGATGIQEPISVLNLIGDNADRLNIDSEGRLYVHFGTNQDIAIFAQGATGNDAPISVIPPFQKPEVAYDYVISKSGKLYVLNHVRPIAIYDDPLNNPFQPSGYIWPDGCCFPFNSTLAFDEATRLLYIQFYVTNNPKYWNKVNFDIRPPTGGDATVHHFIFTGDCGSIEESAVFSTLIVKKYLIVSCNTDGDVLVYRTDQFGRQRSPVEIVGKGTLASPWQMAVGP